MRIVHTMRYVALVFGCVGFFGRSIAFSQTPVHRAVIGPADSSSQEEQWRQARTYKWIGTIRQFDGSKLVMDQDGRPQSVDSSRVESVEFDWANEQTSEAVGLFEQRDYARAVQALGEAIKSGVPRWQQRFLAAQMVQGVSALDRPQTAGKLFLQLAATSPPALLYADAPLKWSGGEVSPQMREEALEWVASDDEIARLLGASWLLFGEHQQQAQRVLIDLQSSERAYVAQLAVAQAWRLSTPPETIPRLGEWLRFRDALIPPLQLGPTEFLAERLMRVGEVELALGELFRIATMHHDRYHRAAKALQAGRNLLQSQGKTTEAEKVGRWLEDLEH